MLVYILRCNFRATDGGYYMDNRKRIMVVEDDSTIRHLMADILREAGHEVVECSTGEEALSGLDSIQPSVITLDLAMPSMDGVEFLQLLRDRSDTPRIAVVVVTAAPEFLRQELSAEGHSTLAKPFHVDQLLATVEEAMDRGQPA